ncbi:hypothetical protein QQ977_03825 [Natrialbaceae archaeon AArc-T1-2]|nr:hypothetical protein [Natrialbaceae archaeon AArc-T1-2]WIV68696.1 hypothetical protein QQ977_03825 [Natrialbaceae archaeon AArc-T1-2]
MPGEEITVHVSHEGPDTIAAATDSLEVRESFGIVLESHGGPAHVHCRLDDALDRVVTLENTNYYVEPPEETYVPVFVDDVDEPVTGRLEVSTGYGATATTVAVTVAPSPAGVEVDESLSRPREPEPEPTPLERIVAGVDSGTLGVLALGAVAIGTAAVTAAVVGGFVAFVGFLVVAVGVGVALVLLLR